MNNHYTDINSSIIDSWVENNWKWGVPISHETYEKALQGEWNVLLTPTKPVPKSWFPDFKGRKILGLASGGGQQMPIFSALGAECTIMDYSQKQLDSELLVASREGYSINIVKADMTQPFPFEKESFDLIFHPVSNCYIEDVFHVWEECFRVLKKGGLLIAGLDNGVNYLFDENETVLTYRLPFNPLKDPELYQECLNKDLGIQFSHSIEEQIGGQLKAGFMLTDLYEDTNGSGRLHEYNVPTFIATRAIKK
ncbi:class I SAM-dependent methyltransferase [Neobacillus sp. YIM B02564]|uniref:Class I SAM-dependent methyltransferase n=1 Tax=Neobacillus paridis TaxID=2803862 RepID=A0ABS1TJW5_9BACI|nr:class I SAM-dependent methyltransferase [Neobacillus paridis]MBL4951552.1 class I SAM-dependent methyltransferase [Neobacillus paridis]